MPSRDTAALDRRLQKKVYELTVAFDKERGAMGDQLRISQTLRTRLEQIAYYLQGRMTLGTVNAVRAEAGLPAITAKENKNTITKTLNSRHLPNADGKSEAVDIFILRKGTAIWDGDDPAYQVAGAIGKSLGLIWGGNWGWDAGHFELPR